MQLLYCDASGVVVLTHDDTDLPVSMAAYPSVVRIIPYDQPLATLPRLGPAPVYPPPTQFDDVRKRPPDTRPYLQPVATKDILKVYAGQVRYSTVIAGFHFTAASGDIPVWTDRESYFLLSGLATWAASVAPSTPISFTQGASAYPITAGEAVALFDEFTVLIQDNRAIEAACIADLDSATPTITTYDDVDARFAAVTAHLSARRPFPKTFPVPDVSP